MSELPKLNFPAIRLRARRREGQVEVWDDLRGIYLVPVSYTHLTLPTNSRV